MSLDVIRKQLRGEFTYLAESDIHFPHLTVSQTLRFAAMARMSQEYKSPADRRAAATESTNATVEALGLKRTLETKVGNSFIRGVSGGERKRTSIAEVLVTGSSLQCWDNSTRGLDSANALQFVQTLRSCARRTSSVAIATLYQASEDIYNSFDKVTLLFEGRQIYFGTTSAAKAYFTELGFVCPKRSTTADFLCSLTNPLERTVRSGYENKTPQTPDDFAQIWNQSPEREKVAAEIQSYQNKFPPASQDLQNAGGHTKLPWRRWSMPYKVSYLEQIRLCVNRGIQRLIMDLPPTISAIAGNAIVSIILGSMFYNLPDDTSSFFNRGVLLFFTILTNTFLASFEGVQLWDHRPITEKQFQIAMYRPSTEAIASMLCDIPNKVLLTAGFNIPFYFLANMRRTPRAFFIFYLFAFTSLLTGSMLYRTIGAMSRTLSASIAPGADFILMLVIYTGFVLPIPSMHPWFRWFGYINPVGYSFESLMINEFSDRQFPCATFVPQGVQYLDAAPDQKMCAVTGAQPGAAVVDGREYLVTTFQYYPEHLWRNLGIQIGLTCLLCGLYLLATEYVSSQRSKGEVLIFRRGQELSAKVNDDEEVQRPRAIVSDLSDAGGRTKGMEVLGGTETHAATFLWNDLCYDVKTKASSRRLLDNVEGWIEPGTLTALMGESGAGKTTLLNVLANRATTGVISGEKIVDAKFQDEGFARKVGYAQQQDMSTPTATVREALIFSARLRQPPKYSDAEKLAYVDEVMLTLGLTEFANAIIGTSGEGLNIEQRKRVTIGIELAARPELLLFLDEPTSGLDSSTAWSICTLLRKLADNGQAILCTIHQPSEVVFDMFDRLLFLQNGHSIYFGNIGPGSETVVEYFCKRGVTRCGTEENPAEWLMEISSRTVDENKKIDWQKIWQTSTERQKIKDALEGMKKRLQAPPTEAPKTKNRGKYASSYLDQLYYVTRRNFEQDWRTPSYLYSKLFLTLGAVSSHRSMSAAKLTVSTRVSSTDSLSTWLLIAYKVSRIKYSRCFWSLPYTAAWFSS
jgi:ATP-binding cassette, subfamily G (WHITE), member 2, PDR